MPRKSFRKSNKSKKSMKSDIRSLKLKVGLMKPEVKFFSTPHVNVPCDTTGSVLSVINMNQAVTRAGRLGNQIRLRKFEGHYKLDAGTGGAAPNTQTYRIFLLKDLDPTPGAVPTIAQILSAAAVETLINDNTYDNFKILEDKEGVISKTTTSISSQRFLKFSLSLHNARQDYQGAAVADYINTGYYLVVLGSQVAGANLAPIMNGISRVYYTDA